MSPHSGVVVRVLTLDDDDVFSQLQVIEGSTAQYSAQATTGTPIKILVRFPNDFQFYGAGGLRMTIAIGQDDERPSHAQTYWYDSTDLHTAQSSHCCFYVWPDTWRTPDTQPIEQKFTVPAPRNGELIL